MPILRGFTRALYSVGGPTSGCSSLLKVSRRANPFFLTHCDRSNTLELRSHSDAPVCCPGEGTHRTIEKDIVSALLPIAIGDRSAHTVPFLAFLEKSSTTRVTLDQWCSFLEFSDKVGPNFEGYEEDGAWPLLLDEYVEQARADAKA